MGESHSTNGAGTIVYSHGENKQFSTSNWYKHRPILDKS
jgi:hypothetical protein